MKKKTLFIGSLISIFILLFFIIYLKFSWLYICSIEEMKQNAAIVNNSIPLPKKFITVYDRIHPYNRSYSMFDQVISQINPITIRKHFMSHNCKCDEVGYLLWDNKNFKFNGNLSRVIQLYPEFGFGLEKYSSPEKCFNFWYQNDIRYRGRYLNDLEELSMLTLKKDLNSLNEEDIIKLILIRRQPNRNWNDTELNQLVRNVKNLKL